MANCYIHPDREARGSCVICGRGICRECSNWAAGDIYLCPSCSQKNAPAAPAREGRKREVVGLSSGAGLSRVFYYATAVIIVVVGAWYVYATFIAPAIVPSGGTPIVVPTPSPSSLTEIWSRYNLLITVSVTMLIVVLVGGELMLRTGPKQPPTIARSKAQVVNPSVRDDSKKSRPIIAQPQILFDRDGPKHAQSATVQPGVQTVTQTLRAEAKPSQREVSKPEPQPATTHTRLVFCIYCGNKIPSTAAFCNKCGKGQS